MPSALAPVGVVLLLLVRAVVGCADEVLSVLVPLPGELIAPGGGFALIRLISLACSPPVMGGGINLAWQCSR